MIGGRVFGLAIAAPAADPTVAQIRDRSRE
jgi:hypothetical protein